MGKRNEKFVQTLSFEHLRAGVKFEESLNLILLKETSKSFRVGPPTHFGGCCGASDKQRVNGGSMGGGECVLCVYA